MMKPTIFVGCQTAPSSSTGSEMVSLTRVRGSGPFRLLSNDGFAAFCSGACDCPSLIPPSSHRARLSGYPELSYGTHDRCHGDTCHLSSLTTATVFPAPFGAFFSYGNAGEREANSESRAGRPQEAS